MGPKPFPLERMVAIFYSIMEEEVIPSPLLYSQVSIINIQRVCGEHKWEMQFTTLYM